MALSRKQLKTIELMFEGNLNQREISKKLDINEATISRWKQDDEFISTRDEYFHNKIGNSAPKALKTMLNLLNAKSEMVRFTASKDLLDRAGFAPTDKKEINATVTPVTIVDDIEGDADG